MEQNKQKTRFEEIDFIRMIVVFSVIGIHVSAEYVASSFYANVWNTMMGNAVQIFLMLSGFGLMYSEMKRKTNYFTFLTKRMPKIVLPYIFWSISYFFIKIYVFGFQGTEQEKIDQLKQGIVMGNTIYHLYFLIILMFLYLLFPILKKLVLSFPLFTLVVTVLSFGVVVYYKNDLLTTFGMYGYYQPLFWLVYFVAGMLLARNLTKVSNIAKSYAGIWFVLWIGVFYVFYQRNTSSFLESIPEPYVRLVYIFVSFLALLGFASLLYQKKSNGFSFVRFISKHSFLIYLSHPLVLIIWEDVMLRHPEWKELFFHGAGMFIKYIIVVIATILFTIIVSVLPGRSLFGGVKPWNDKKKVRRRNVNIPKNAQTNLEQNLERMIKKETI